MAAESSTKLASLKLPEIALSTDPTALDSDFSVTDGKVEINSPLSSAVSVGRGVVVVVVVVVLVVVLVDLRKDSLGLEVEALACAPKRLLGLGVLASAAGCGPEVDELRALLAVKLLPNLDLVPVAGIELEDDDDDSVTEKAVLVLTMGLDELVFAVS